MKADKNYPAVLISALLVSILSFSASAAELDITFGIDGRVATSIGNYEDHAFAVALQQDGRILVGGTSSNGADLDFALARYSSDGSLDRTFNFDGTATTQVGRADDVIAALAVQDDGYILAAGYSVQNGSKDFALVRYTPDGQKDPAFGLDGIVVTEFGTLDDEITAMTIDESGRIVVAGYSTGTSGRAVIVGRYLAGGEPDLTFGHEGISLTGIGEDAIARGVDVDDLGRIVVSGSYFHDERTEVMVLRFTDDGRLDTSFGVDGLGLAGYIEDSTEGFGVRLHESGAILVAGSVGMPDETDAALFVFDEDGWPDPGFGDNGMLVIEASLEDDMALAVDVRNDVVYLSGFTSTDGVREFLFISLQVSLPETSTEEVAGGGSVPFILNTGSATTGLIIGERQVADSYEEYFAGEGSGMVPILTTISQTAFGVFSNDTSYAVAVQPDGRAVAAGVSEDNGIVSFAVARFADEMSVSGANAVSSSTPTSWLETKTPFEVTRTGAISGGVITGSGISITQRGVVFSIAPDPVLKSGGSDGGAGGDGSGGDGSGGTDTTPPVVTVTAPSGTLPEGTNQTTLSVTTNETAVCRYSDTAGSTFAQMTNFTTTGGKSHTTTLTNIIDGDKFFIKCQDSSGNTNSSDTVVTIAIATTQVADDAVIPVDMERVAARIGGFMVGTVHAQTGTTDSGSDTTVTSVFDTSTSFIEEGFTEDGSGTGSFSSIIKNLKPGTFYYVRAYAVSDAGTIYYGDQEGFKTADSCFIATAAYGSILHASVKLLREFRDRYLMTNTPGRIFVKVYYEYSPPVADAIAGSPVLRAVVRVLLLPLVGVSWLLLNLGAAGVLLAASLLILPYLVYRGARRSAC